MTRSEIGSGTLVNGKEAVAENIHRFQVELNSSGTHIKPRVMSDNKVYIAAKQDDTFAIAPQRIAAYEDVDIQQFQDVNLRAKYHSSDANRFLRKIGEVATGDLHNQLHQILSNQLSQIGAKVNKKATFIVLA